MTASIVPKTKHFTTGMMLSERLEVRSEFVTESGCQIWTGAANRRGYGIIRTEKVNQYTHRAAYELINGKIPEGKMVCHSCDNPSCINPNHLFLGDYVINMIDKINKNRHSKGITAAAAKLTNNDVMNIRIDDSIQSAIAQKYGISQSAVSAIKTRRNWNHL